MVTLPVWHRKPDLDLGHDHLAYFFSWGEYEHAGIFIRHWPLHPEKITVEWDGACIGAVNFDLPGVRDVHATWKVHDWNPLTLKPSILCKCGDHGWLTADRWEPA